MDSNLLKEAIADAKAVRATALANAKVALEEQFAPRFQAMFAEKLQQEAQENDINTPPVKESQKPVEEENVSESEIDALIKELEDEVGDDSAVAPPMDAEPPVDTEPPMDDAAPAVGAPIPAGVPVIITPVDQAAGAPPVPPVPPTDEAPPMGSPEDDQEVDLNELLESLKEEAEEEEEGLVKENVPVKSSAIGGKVGGSDNKKPSADASATSHVESAGKDRVGMPTAKVTAQEPTDASRPNQGANVTKTNLSTPGGALKENVETGVPGGKVTAKEPTEADRPNEGEHATKTDLSTPALAKENAMLKKQLDEATRTVTFIKGQLNEINLLNAKLLYTNKLFKEFTMSNEQKMRIVEQFDLTKNVREVKLTYANIAESINFSGNMKRKTVSSSVQSITEGIASKQVASTKPSKEIISEGNKFANRMKQLAGIPSVKK